MRSDKWRRDQLKLAFFLYCQLPFGKLHQRRNDLSQIHLSWNGVGNTDSIESLERLLL